MLAKFILIGYVWAFFYQIPILAWQAYESPLQLAKPNSNGVYEFDLVLQYTVSMYSYDLKSPIDYDTQAQSWMRQNNSYHAPCDASNTLVNSQNNNITSIDNLLNTVNQYNGLHHRLISINGKIPGDTIVVPLGAEVIMRVKNRLNTESVTIHVHGVNKQNLWYTDGVGLLQQCPIFVGSDYSYRFIADTPGTHFYHGHLSVGRGDGNVGGFVVIKPNETTPDLNGTRLNIEREYYVLIQDIGIVSTNDQLSAGLLGLQKYNDKIDDISSTSCWNPTKTYDGTTIAFISPISAILIGDKGWHRQDDLRQIPSKLPLSTYLIKKGENVRFRFVNGGIGHMIMIWLEQHKFIVVAADGVEIKPYQIDALVIFPGERYDVLVQGLSNPQQKNYRFIFESMERYNLELEDVNKTIGLANLQYEDSPLNDTDLIDFNHNLCTQHNSCVVLNCPFGRFRSDYNYTCKNVGELENGKPIDDKEVIEQKVFTQGYEEYFINIDHDDGMNGIHFKMPHGMPYYNYGNEEQILTPCAASSCNTSAGMNCECFHHFNLTLNNIVQITLYNMGKGGNINNGYAHPFHFHGTHFYVMKLVYPPTYDEKGLLNSTSPDVPCNNITRECFGLKWTNSSWLNGNVEGMYKNPTLRDTIVVPTGGYVVIRFRAKNPGWWFAHCHLLLHHLKGMSFAIRIGEHNEIPIPPEAKLLPYANTKQNYIQQSYN
uniref:Uncharacterized protein n=2 Tax=Acrobeloides nanus TaxID=290746 RepID=A0A914C4Z8_9BILA